VNKTTPTPSKYEAPPSNNEASTLHYMNPKEYTVEGSTGKEYTVKQEARKMKKRAHEEARASSFLSPSIDDSDNHDAGCRIQD
jgi:hypothetical protein